MTENPDLKNPPNVLENAQNAFSSTVQHDLSQTSFPPQQNWNPPRQFPPPPQSQQNYRPDYRSKSPKKKLAIISLILGILSFPFINLIIALIFTVIGASLSGVAGAAIGLLLPLLFLPGGLITGIIALVKANKRPHEYGGKGLAIAGIVLSGFSILVIPLVIAIAIPNLLAARRAANEGSAISSLRTLADAQVKFALTKYRCGELTELGQNKMIDTVLTTGVKTGYVFTITRTPNGCDIYAKPTDEDGVKATGTRSFYYSIEEGVLRTSATKRTFPTRESPVLDVAGFPPAYSFTPEQIATK